MAIIQSGAGASGTLTVDSANAALVSVRPQQPSGSYRFVAQTGLLPSSLAASTLFTWRYSGTGVAVLRRIEIGLLVGTAYTQGNVRISAYHTRSNFTQGSTNATQVSFAGNNAKKRTSYSATNCTAWACTTAGITGDAATNEDTVAFATDLLNLPSTIQPVSFTSGMHDLYNCDGINNSMIFATTEGFRIKNDTAFAATGASNLVVMIDWDEYTSY